MRLPVRTSPGSRPIVFLLIYLLGFKLCLTLLGLPLFQQYPSGGFFSVLWCLGLFSWAIRLIRSRNSQFNIQSVLGVITFAAAMFALGKISPNIAVFVIFCCAVTSDVGVRQSGESNVWTTTFQLLQVLAGLSGLAKLTRGMFHEWFA